jgi:hypothetical protein
LKNCNRIHPECDQSGIRASFKRLKACPTGLI